MVKDWIDFVEFLLLKSIGRMNWFKEEIEIILKYFLNFKKFFIKKEIIEAFDNIDEFKSLLNIRGFLRCLDKVKNIFKKLKKVELN